MLRYKGAEYRNAGQAIFPLIIAGGQGIIEIQYVFKRQPFRLGIIHERFAMRIITLFLMAVLLSACGRPSPENQAVTATEGIPVERLNENLNLIAGKYSINVDTLMRLLNDYGSYAGVQDFKADLARVRVFQKEEAFLDDELDQVLDVPGALRLISQKYNMPESVIASMVMDYRLLAVH